MPHRFSSAASRWSTVLIVVCLAAFPHSLSTADLPASEAPLAARFEAAADAAASLPRLHSLLVSWRGEIALERYFNGARATRPANIKSASKSIISALVGIAIDRGLIQSVRDPVAAYFPDYFPVRSPERRASDADRSKQAITIEDLLTMQSGLETTSNRNYGAWVHSPNWVRWALSRPMVSEPGTTMQYSTGNTHVLSAILTKATGTSTWAFAQQTLGKPLGFALPAWPRDPQGIYFGGNDMLMTPRQMLAFGEMYLNGGRVNGRQVVPEKWVEASRVRRAQSLRESDRYYGYGWWVRELAGHETYYAWGFGGQFIFIVPSLDLVVVTTSASTASEDRRSHRLTVYDLVENFIIAPIASQDRNTPMESAVR